MTPSSRFSLVHVLVLLIVLVSSGCTVTSYREKEGARFFRGSLGTDQRVGEITVTTDEKGLKSLTVKGASSEQGETTRSAIDAAKSLVPAAVR